MNEGLIVWREGRGREKGTGDQNPDLQMAAGLLDDSRFEDVGFSDPEEMLPIYFAQ